MSIHFLPQWTTALSLIFTVIASAQQPPSDQRHKDTMARGTHAMGFDQATTIHHFRIEATGGTIEITARAEAAPTTVDDIRRHLRHISMAFGQGDFSLPMLVHDERPPGVEVLQERREQLKFQYREIAGGGKIVINTADKAALDALHEFFRYQIREHRTGDPVKPPK
jgi:hypothetical protein